MSCAEEMTALTTELSNMKSKLQEVTDANEAFSIQIDNQATTIGNLQEEVIEFNTISAQNEAYATAIENNQAVIAQRNMEIGAMRENFEKVVKAVSPTAYSTYSEEFYTDAEVANQIAKRAERNRTTRITNVIDTVESPKYKINEGNLAVFCPPDMTFKKPHDVMAMIADFISEEDVKDALFTQLQRHEPNITRANLNQETTLIEKIEYYDLIRLELESPVKDAFEIYKVHDIDEQKIQRGMEGWHWKVTPISDEPNQSLVVKATFVAPNGGRKAPISKSYPINVTVEPTRFFHTAKMLMINDPGWAIVTLIIPFLTFLWGYFIKNKKVKKIISGESS